MNADDNAQEISGTLTRMQWKEVRKALKTRRTFVNRAVRDGTADKQDSLMIDAIIEYLDQLLASSRTSPAQ